MAATFAAFDSFVRSRTEAAGLVAAATCASGDSVYLLGADAGLLRRLAAVALATEGAGLTSCGGPPSVAGRVVLAAAASAVPPDRTAVYVRSSDEPRDPASVRATSHEFEALPGGADAVDADFRRFMRTLRCAPAPCLGPGSYFVSLTFPDVTTAMDAGDEWSPPAWAMTQAGGPLHGGLELRADLLQSQDVAFVLSQLAIVRRRSSGLPIIYTVRSKDQGGAFPNDEAAAWRLMTAGLRFGAEYIDMEACWSQEGRAAFLSLAKASLSGVRVIGSYHDVQRPLSAITDSELHALFHECSCARGPAFAAVSDAVDIVKLVGRAESAQCSIRVNQAARAVRASLPPSVSSLIAICTTDAGRLSRALNVMLGPTPVAHPSLPGKAAPGQLSAVEIEGIRRTLGLPVGPE